MSYTPHTWVNNETITAAKLNNIEEGISEAAQSGGGGVLICNSSYDGNEDNYVLDKTAQEIYDALLAGTPVYIKYQYGSTESYTGELYLAPVIRFSNYNYTNDLKIYASKPVHGQVSSTSAVGIPGVLTYIASGLDEYPVFDYARTSAVNEASANNDVGID